MSTQCLVIVNGYLEGKFDRMCEALRDLKTQEIERIRWTKIEAASNMFLALTLIGLSIAAFILAR